MYLIPLRHEQFSAIICMRKPGGITFLASAVYFKENNMDKTQTLRGMATVSFWADDVKAARKWYSELLGIDPYFERPDSANPAYVEFRFGDFQHELGIIDRK